MYIHSRIMNNAFNFIYIRWIGRNFMFCWKCLPQSNRHFIYKFMLATDAPYNGLQSTLYSLMVTNALLNALEYIYLYIHKYILYVFLFNFASKFTINLLFKVHNKETQFDGVLQMSCIKSSLINKMLLLSTLKLCAKCLSVLMKWHFHNCKLPVTLDINFRAHKFYGMIKSVNVTLKVMYVWDGMDGGEG